MSLYILLFLLAGIGAAWAVVSAVSIIATLDQRGIRTSFMLMRLEFLRNLSRYREVTRSETGRPGFWFHSYLVSINAAWILAVAALVARSWR